MVLKHVITGLPWETRGKQMSVHVKRAILGSYVEFFNIGIWLEKPTLEVSYVVLALGVEKLNI